VHFLFSMACTVGMQPDLLWFVMHYFSLFQYFFQFTMGSYSSWKFLRCLFFLTFFGRWLKHNIVAQPYYYWWTHVYCIRIMAPCIPIIVCKEDSAMFNLQYTAYHKIDTYCGKQRWMGHKGGPMKNALHAQRYDKRHLLGWGNIEQWKNQDHIS